MQPQVRKDFPDAIYWIGDLVTGADGTAKVAIKYPDALTTWRLTARAVTTDTRAGAAVARTTTTKDLIVRVITPRFLTEGDQVVVPTIVHNYLEEPKDATITFDAKGLQPAAGTALTPIAATIPPKGERRDDWRFVRSRARQRDRHRDREDQHGYRRRGAPGSGAPLRPAPRGRAQRVALRRRRARRRRSRFPPRPTPPGAACACRSRRRWRDRCSARSTSSRRIPYGCTEQTLSSFLPNLMVTRALTQLKLTPTERMSVLDRQVTDGLRRLADYQHEDGGWGWWKTDDNHPFMTAYALYGLDEARRAGYQIDQERLANGLRALASMYADYPRAEPDLKAYMAYVLGRAAPEGEAIQFQRSTEGGGSGQTAEHRRADALNDVWSARDRMSPYGRALLLLALDEAKDARGNELAQTPDG